MYREWYFTEFYREEEIDDWVRGGRVKPCGTFGSYVLLINLDEKKDAQLDFTFFYEDRPPAKASYGLQAGRQGLVFLGERATDVPEGVDIQRRFSLRVQSSTPVIVQSTQGDYISGSPVTNNMVTNMFIPGPLGDQHRVWYYVDCIVLRNPTPLEEREWLALLNPGTVPANVTLTFIPGGGLWSGTARPTAADTAEQPFQVQLQVPAERLFRTRLHEDIKEVQPNHHYGVRIESDQPITAQATRRIFERGNYAFSRSMAVLDCLPVGSLPIE